MALTMRERQSVTKETAQRYRKAKKKERGQILNEFVALTKYNRSYAAFVLRNYGLKRALPGTKTIFICEKTKGRQRPKRYDMEVETALKFIWRLLDQPCGKRLAPYLKEIIPVLEEFGELNLDKKTKEKLLIISAATIDRILRPVKKKETLKPKGNTKPGSLLKSQIPIRTFADWDEALPGFVEIDLVAHDGGNASGEFCQTLDATDVATCWTETIAVRNKAQKWVFEAIEQMRKRFPFPLLGIDSDNGGEFINNNLRRYCECNEITFTRSRPYRKNDNCYVEQKNYSVVRKAVGYMRHDTEEELVLLNELYIALRLYTNFFQPTMKLVSKTRTGSKVTKKYDVAQTPYGRVLDSPAVSQRDKNRLTKEYATINPVALKRSMAKLQNKLFKIVVKKAHQQPSAFDNDLEYILCEVT